MEPVSVCEKEKKIANEEEEVFIPKTIRFIN